MRHEKEVCTKMFPYMDSAHELLSYNQNPCYNLKLMSQNNGELNCQVNKNAQLSCKRTMTIFLQTQF